jgi:hypothetical protein
VGDEVVVVASVADGEGGSGEGGGEGGEAVAISHEQCQLLGSKSA